MSELVDAKELAERLKVTPATIHAWHIRRDSPCRLGRCVQYPVDHLREYIDAQKQGGNA